MENTPRNPAAFSIPASSIAPASRMREYVASLLPARCPKVLPHKSLPVRFPFSGDEEVGILNLFCKVQSFQKKLYAGFQLCIQKCVETAPHTACRTSTGMQGYVFAGSAEYDVRKMLHSNIQFLHHIRVCSFLGSEYVAAPLGPKKGLRTSHAAVKHAFFSVGWAEELSMELISDRRAPHRAMPFSMLPTSCPSYRRNGIPMLAAFPDRHRSWRSLQVR